MGPSAEAFGTFSQRVLQEEVGKGQQAGTGPGTGSGVGRAGQAGLAPRAFPASASASGLNHPWAFAGGSGSWVGHTHMPSVPTRLGAVGQPGRRAQSESPVCGVPIHQRQTSCHCFPAPGTLVPLRPGGWGCPWRQCPCRQSSGDGRLTGETERAEFQEQ